MTDRTHLKTLLAMSMSLLMMAYTATAEIIFVDADASGANNGSSWADAYNYLRYALNDASSGDEIQVAQGIYRPNQGVMAIPDFNWRTTTFQLINGVTIKGGYAGFGQPDPNARDIELYETILTGDLLGDDGPNFDDNQENSYHVVTGSGTDETAVLDGFTITAGNANGPWQDHQNDGGGMYNECGSPTLLNCTFSGNSAEVGGGMANYSSSPTVTNCMFSGNLAIFGGGMYDRESSPILTNCTFSENFATINHGGGIYNCDSSSPTLTNCTFSGNSARTGAGIMNLRSSPTLTDCTFSGNSASQYGGGMENNDNSNSTLINCTFSGNSAGNRGGGMYNCRDSSPILNNCTFSGNTAKRGGGMYTRRGSPIMTNCTFSGNTAFRFDEVGEGGGIYNSYNGSPILTNCILYNNSDEAGTVEFSQMHNTTYASAVVNYSCIQGWTGNLGGTGNIGDDPLFLDADGADNVIGTDDDNLRLLPGSPCIDAGDNSAVPPSVLTDLDGDPRIANGTVDMGAYEGPTQGFLLNTQSLTVPEDQTATFTVALAMDPLGTVQVTVTHVSGDGDISVQSGASLTFDSSNYSGPQTVTLTAAEDQDYFYGKALIWISAPGFFTAGLTATEWDNDAPTVLYVDGTASGANNGLSWADAFTDLQDALSIAAVIPQIGEIRVAQGIYKPDQGNGNMPGDRNATFQLINGLAIKGGYAGASSGDAASTDFGRPDPCARDIQLYEAILSGDLNGDDGPNFANNGENSYHVVTGSGTDATAFLDGFTITKGGNSSGHGAGMYNSSGSPTVTNCTFTGNDGGGMFNVGSCPTLTNCSLTCNLASNGGGMFNSYMSRPVLTNCTFSENIALAYESGYGGGMYNDNSSPVLTNCIFTRNMADTLIPDHGGGDGGGMFNDRSNPTLTNCTFTENKALCGGAGMGNRSSSPTLNNCIFTGNLAIGSWGRWGEGGAILNEYSTPVINNCTFSGNSASRSGGGMFNSSSHPILTNCIFWGDTPEEIHLGHSSTALITYSDVQGGWDGESNIDTLPCFVEPGYWDANGLWVEGDYHLREDSLCIDAGDPNYIAEPNETDLDGRPRIIGGRVDMGAYEYSPSIPAKVRIVPLTINLASKGKWITCYICLPEEYNVARIDPNSVLLEDEIQAQSLWLDEEEQVAIAKFSRSAVQGILNIGWVELTITGELTDGTVFEGTDVIRVIDKGGRKSAK